MHLNIFEQYLRIQNRVHFTSLGSSLLIFFVVWYENCQLGCTTAALLVYVSKRLLSAYIYLPKRWLYNRICAREKICSPDTSHSRTKILSSNKKEMFWCLFHYNWKLMRQLDWSKLHQPANSIFLRNIWCTIGGTNLFFYKVFITKQH